MVPDRARHLAAYDFQNLHFAVKSSFLVGLKKTLSPPDEGSKFWPVLRGLKMCPHPDFLLKQAKMTLRKDYIHICSIFKASKNF